MGMRSSEAESTGNALGTRGRPRGDEGTRGRGLGSGRPELAQGWVGFQVRWQKGHQVKRLKRMGAVKPGGCPALGGEMLEEQDGVDDKGL